MADEPDSAPLAHHAGPRVWTIGHSTYPVDAFLRLLHDSGIQLLADVRRYPGSRRHPQFAREALAASLQQAGIGYAWLPELGGRRAPRKDSRNTAWRNAGFRGYADYMETEAFQLGVGRLLELARDRLTAIMCAERAWQQCHRGLIADYLKAQGVEVVHIGERGTTAEHPYSEAARLVHGCLSYAEAQPGQRDLDFD